MPRASHRFVLLTGAGVTALAIGLAGCSSSQPGPSESPQAPTPEQSASASPASFMAQAAEATQAAGSAKIATNVTMQSEDKRLGEITVKGQGVANFAEQAVDMTLNMSAMGMNQEMKIRLVDGTGYVQMSMLGDKWIQAPPSQVGANVQDPSQLLSTLKELGDLKEAGTEEVNGAPATKYTGQIDIAKALANSGMSEEQLQQMQGELDKIGKTADIAVFVDQEGRVVRMDQSLTANIPQTGPMTMKSVTVFSDFGVQTDITPPPADQVTQMPTIPSPGAS